MKFRNPSLCIVAFLLASNTATAAKAVTYSYLGNPETANVTAKPVSCAQGACSPSIALVGGGYDVGEAFRWMIARAGITPATGGRFVIIRATGTDAYNPYIYSRLGQVDTSSPRGYEMVGGIDLGLSSVETLVISSRAMAEDPQVLKVVGRANAIFIAGGDQADYYNYWQSTSLANLIQKAVNAGIPVGGTSAGTAMLGQYAFAALNGSIETPGALSNPFDRAVTIDPLNTSSKKFVQTGPFVSVPTLGKMITDSHFNTRDRLGRLFSFVARIGNGCTGGVTNYGDVAGIGIDEETAVLISGAPGAAKAELAVNPYNAENTTSLYTAQNSAYFVKYTAAPSQCAAKQPLVSNSGIQVYRLSGQPGKPSPYPSAPQYSFKANASFNTSNWASQLVQTYADGSSLNGPYYYGASGGAVLGSSIR
ncbi:Cyanophycinase [Massilia sp. Bi118]|uniref:cyanophycinase n=1 Tax=Massilia sp. Bi118 TaxID=2822346 RepID=UPI001D67772F|nr:cyanophycinase [Massilia sp. Bi118]CAH0292014.1 Cyanophycinase [Massilia sp. Bi118]